MNFDDLEPYDDERYDWPRPRPRLSPDYDLPVTPLNIRLDADRSPSFNSSISDPTTVIHWPSIRLPSHPESQRLPLSPFETPPELRKPPRAEKRPIDCERYTERHEIFPPISALSHQPGPSSLTTYPNTETQTERLTNRQTERQNTFPSTSEFHYLTNDNEPQSSTEEPTSRWTYGTLPETERCFDTPTSVNTTSYIRFTLDQLTRHEEVRQLPYYSSHLADDYPVERFIPDYGLSQANFPCPSPTSELMFSNRFMPDNVISRMTPETEREGMALTRKYRSTPTPDRSFSLYPSTYIDPSSRIKMTEPQSFPIQSPIAPLQPSSSNIHNIFIPIDNPMDSTKNPQLNFIPMTLRPFSMIILALICIVLIVSITYCAISSRNNGLMDFNESDSGRQEFIMKFGPPIFAGFVFLHVQSVMFAITRIMPFTILASPSKVKTRSNRALFMRIYPIMLWPTHVGNKYMNLCMLIFWSSILTVPLQSCLFSIRPMGTSQRWVMVQGIAWTLVTIYSFILGASLVTCSFFFRRKTGLLWDPRSLADLIAMLPPQSNAFPKFSGTDIMMTKEQIQYNLGQLNLRLGYWKTSHASGSELIYGLGEERDDCSRDVCSIPLDQHLSEPNLGQMTDTERGNRWHDRRIRYRYLPWYLRDAFLTFCLVVGIVFWLTLLIVSFLPMTTVFKDFVPRVSNLFDPNGFSVASFLLSFGPSVLGMLLYLLFQPLDMALRVLKPWSELSKSNGATADESLLLDYPASLPIYVSLSALTFGHYRISILSILSNLFLLIPILSGGLFYPATTVLINQTLKPNMTVYILLISLIFLYLLGIVLIFSSQHRIRLPHDISCLAEIISFIYNSHIINDAAFSRVRSKAELSTRLLIENRGSGMYRWAFGVFKGRDGKDSMGIERVGRNPGVGLMIMSAQLKK